ncbi:hypothetical protein AG4045_021142 [Apium graveolens]|uniref:Uncharacterized protein n=1 Tax=Apium graveolens TaxID=4045 RepID=A0A6L5B955_APIGR|nr:hypothetical protein AG4045_021142 [Apium graveolens]
MSSSSLSPSSHPLFSSTFTPSLYILYNNPQPTSSKSFNISRFKLFSSHQTVEFDTQKIKPTKKKRKPRPSFLEQIEDKWCVKTTSLRQKFPWEEEKSEKSEKSEFFQEKVEFDEFTESRTDGNSVVSDGFVENRVKFAPWDQRSKNTNAQVEFDAGTESRSDGNSVVSDGYVRNRVKFAPWDQRTKIKNTQVEFEGGRGIKVDEFDGVESRIDESDSVKFVPWDQRRKFDEAQVDYEAGNVESRNGKGKRFYEFPEGYDEDEEAYLEVYDSGDEDGNTSLGRHFDIDESKKKMQSRRYS